MTWPWRKCPQCSDPTCLPRLTSDRQDTGFGGYLADLERIMPTMCLAQAAELITSARPCIWRMETNFGDARYTKRTNTYSLQLCLGANKACGVAIASPWRLRSLTRWAKGNWARWFRRNLHNLSSSASPSLKSLSAMYSHLSCSRLSQSQSSNPPELTKESARALRVADTSFFSNPIPLRRVPATSFLSINY